MDEYFKQRELIDRRKRQHYLMLGQIQLLPHSEELRKQFFETLSDEKPSLMGKEVETDFDAFEKAKKALKRYQ